jgi:hypothetical protein
VHSRCMAPASFLLDKHPMPMTAYLWLIQQLLLQTVLRCEG